MHTLLVVSGGFALLAACLLAGRAARAVPRAAIAFIGLWLACSAFNMWYGVARAGYSISAELPIFFAVFGIPAAAALLARRWLA